MQVKKKKIDYRTLCRAGVLIAPLVLSSTAFADDCEELEDYAKSLEQKSKLGERPTAPSAGQHSESHKSCMALAFRFHDQIGADHFDQAALESCYQLKCSFKGSMSPVIYDACKGAGKTSAICSKWARLLLRGEGVALSKTRRAVGGTLIGLGIASAILGAVHIAVPIFKLPLQSDAAICDRNGIRVTCEANPLGLGISLIGIGGISIGVGGAVLTGKFSD